MDLGKTDRDNDLLTNFAIGLIGAFSQTFTSHVGMGSTSQKTLGDLFNNCLISVSVRHPNVSILDIPDSSTNGIFCDKILEGNRQCIFSIF